MKLSSECISCVLSSALELMAKQLPAKQHQPTAAEMLKLASQQNWQQSPPEFARELYGFLQECGGSKDSYLNQMTANDTGLPVYAGPSEGTALGNLMAQMLSDGVFSSLEEARAAIRPSFGIKEYLPR